MKLTRHVATRIAGRLDREGWPWPVTTADVYAVYESGTLPDEKESLASAILDGFEEYGVEVPA